MKVLFIVDTLGAGGAERSLQELLPEFRAGGLSPLVACFRRRTEGVEHLILGEYDARVLSGGRLEQMAALRTIVREQAVQLVHTTLFEADIFGRPAVAGLQVPVVTSIVNMPYEPARLEHDPNVDRLRLLAARTLEIATGALFADHFHAITEAVKNAAAKRLFIPRNRVTVVHRGRDPERLGRRSLERRQRVRAALGLAPDTLVVLNAARQEFQKGQRFLLEAFAELPRAAGSAVLLIAGREGNASKVLRETAKRFGLDVRFLGHREDVPDLMAASDVFVLPSLWEGLGCVLIEALALELPIIASDLEPIREIVGAGNMAVLTKPGDVPALASALRELLGNRARADEVTRRGRTFFERHLTIQESARGMLRLFERVLQGRGSLPKRATPT